MASGGAADPLLENAEELTSEIQTMLSSAYNPELMEIQTPDGQPHSSRREEYVPESGYRTKSTGIEVGGTEAGRQTGRPSPSPDVRPKTTGVVTSTPGFDRQIERNRASSTPATPSSRWNRQALFPEDTVRDQVHSYLEDVSRNMGGRYPVRPVNPPKFSPGGDWRCFLAEFKDMVCLADMKPSHQLAYFKQSVPDEAKKMLYQHKVTTVNQAIRMLTELYEPVKDTWTVLQELEKITQNPGERLRVLAGRIEGVARRYSETLEATSRVTSNNRKS